jgi:hypothetical protein
MPKDPKRNIQSYQIEGGHLNEFEFQKSQGEMTEEAELPFADETENPKLTQAERVAEVTAEAHRKVVKRKKRRVTEVGGRPRSAGKRSAKKRTKTSAKKSLAPAGTKKRARVKSPSKRPGAKR